MENSRISYYRHDLKIAELKKELIGEAISARLQSGAVTSDQLVTLAEVLKDAEGADEDKRDNLEKALAEERGEEGGEPDGKEGK